MSREKWDAPAADLIAMNAWHRDLRGLAGELHNIGLDDPEEALLKLDGIVAVASEWRALIQRRADERAEPTYEPYDSGWVSLFNGGQR